MWLLIFIIFLLFARVESISSLDVGPNNTNFCPAPYFQFKRPMPFIHGLISTTSKILIEQMEHECQIAEIPGTSCNTPSVYEQIIIACGAVVAAMANLGPMVPAQRMNQVSPDRKRLLLFCSLTLASNLSWVFYFGSNDCRNLFSYLSLLFGCICQGFFAWFFRQQQYNKWKCVSSVIVAIVITALVGFTATHHSIRLGSTIFGTNMIAGLAGICGVIFNAISIRLRAIFGSGRFHWFPFLLALFGAGSALMSLFSQNWRKEKLGELSFKIGISILFSGRLYELYQLWSYRHQPVADSTGNDVTAPLLSSTTQDDNVTGHNNPRITITVAEDGRVRADEEVIESTSDDEDTDNDDNNQTTIQEPTLAVTAALAEGKKTAEICSTDEENDKDDSKKPDDGIKGKGEEKSDKDDCEQAVEKTNCHYTQGLASGIQDGHAGEDAGLDGVLRTSDRREDCS